MTQSETHSILDETTREEVATLAARSTSVMEEFETLCSARTPLVDELIELTEHLVSENDQLRLQCAQAESEALTNKRKLGIFVSEAGELAMHHRRIVTLLSDVLDVVTERMRSQKDEDKRIDAAREIAFSRARFGIGEPNGTTNGLFQGPAVADHDYGSAKVPAHAARDGIDEDLQAEIVRTMDGFAQMKPA